jgi:hypothetical protein
MAVRVKPGPRRAFFLRAGVEEGRPVRGHPRSGFETTSSVARRRRYEINNNEMHSAQLVLSRKTNPSARR